MKKLVQAIFLLFCAIALGIAVYYLVRERSGAAAAAKPVTTRQVVVSNDGAGAEERDPRAGRAAAVNHIAALPNEVILDVAPINLIQNEGGEGEEQVLTVRKTDRPDGRLFVVVAEYLPTRKTWVRAWEGETLATKLTTFTIQAKDLIGDHILNIVCMGMNEEDEQTVTVFRRNPGTSLLGYTMIFSTAADAIAIGETERSEGYQLGQTNGDSWPVYAFRHDKDSANLLDQVKTSYAWDYKRGAFLKAGEERIPGAQVEHDMVAKVLTGSEKDFESFLQGLWYESGKGPLDPGTRMLVFDRQGGSITFYSTESQEVFRWTDSHSTRYGLYVGSQNESVSNLRRLMDLELTGADSISVRVFEDLQMKVDAENRWDGSYRKLPPNLSESLSRGAKPAPAMKLAGRFISADGTELEFASPRYELRKGQATERGAFTVFGLGDDTVMEFRVQEGGASGSSRRTYGASFSETKSGKQILRRLVLSPARTSLMGLELLQEPSLVLEQRVNG
ncbi:MAG TPA: pallilysin-related adhesin [Rectinemataceae bacterium]|nr:pallilysin-related adhesin [Rectinemataceae bacterium]